MRHRVRRLEALSLVAVLLTVGLAASVGSTTVPVPAVDHPCPDGPNTQHAATAGCTAWTNHVDAANDRGFEQVAIADGLVVAAGSLTPVDGEARDLTVAAFSAETGERVWTYRFDDHPEGSAYVEDLLVGPDGDTVYAVGLATEGFVDLDGYTANHFEAVALALDAADGTPDWTQTFSRAGEPQSFGDGFWGAGLTADGDLVAVGGSEDPEGGEDLLAIAYDAEEGEQAWRTLEDARNGALTDVEAGPGDQLVAAGFDDDWDAIVAELDPANGDLVRERSHAVDGADLGFAEVAFAEGGDNVLVAQGGNGGQLVASYAAADLSQSWAETDIPAQGIFDEPTLAVDDERQQIVLGGGLGGAAGLQAFSVADGELTWTEEWSAPGDVQGLDLGPEGERLLATGWVYEDVELYDSHRIRVQLLDADDGEEVWMRGNTVQYHEEGKAAAVGPDGEQAYAVGARNDDQNTANQDAHVRALKVEGPLTGLEAPAP